MQQPRGLTPQQPAVAEQGGQQPPPPRQPWEEASPPGQKKSTVGLGKRQEN